MRKDMVLPEFHRQAKERRVAWGTPFGYFGKLLIQFSHTNM